MESKSCEVMLQTKRLSKGQDPKSKTSNRTGSVAEGSPDSCGGLVSAQLLCEQ